MKNKITEPFPEWEKILCENENSHRINICTFLQTVINTRELLKKSFFFAVNIIKHQRLLNCDPNIKRETKKEGKK